MIPNSEVAVCSDLAENYHPKGLCQQVMGGVAPNIDNEFYGAQFDAGR